MPNWNAIFEAEMNLGRDGTDVVYVDVMFTMDSSGSMSWNDPSGYRKIAAKSFVGALISGDRAGVVDFDSYANLIRPLTPDFDSVNASIDSLDSSGGTNIGAGVSVANNHLISSGDPEHAWMMILLTDGQGSYNDYYTQQAIENNIAIYTIGLGSGINSALLTSIATATGGQYYPVSSADQLPDVFREISGEIEPTDSDGDGIPDVTETNGFRDGRGKWYTTDPNEPDTDGDGLSDGVEAGGIIEVQGRTFFNVISNPMLEDGDNDGIDDLSELSLGIDPFNPDTDFDGINDNIDPEPLIPRTVSPEPGKFEIGRDIITGVIFGETGIEGGSANWLVGNEVASSPYYVLGWIGFSLVPVVGAIADARDALQAYYNGDELGAALNAAGVFSSLGDVVKVGGALVAFVTKYPSKTSEVGKVLAKYLLKYVPSDDVIKASLKAIYGGSEIETLLNKGVDIKVIRELIEKVDVDPRDLSYAAKIGDQLRYLTKERWSHILGRLIDGSIKPNIYTSFFPTGRTILADIKRTEYSLPSKMDDAQIEKLIFETIERGTTKSIWNGENIEYILNPGKYGISELVVWIKKSTGKIESGFPKKGDDVWAWNGIDNWVNVK